MAHYIQTSSLVIGSSEILSANFTISLAASVNHILGNLTCPAVLNLSGLIALPFVSGINVINVNTSQLVITKLYKSEVVATKPQRHD